MVADDTYYITPHEAALAAVATSMKKARLQLDTLLVNALLGGVLFSTGSILCVALHSENPVLWETNPGITNLMSGIAFGIGLFYVVIMGADLFNSNILFFSVGLLRRAVSIYDLLVSWSVSLIANLGGSLFVAYLFCHLSGISSQPLWVAGSRKLVEDKASFTFIQTFLKSIMGNFLVCLAIYLQLMAKPIHVKFIVLVLPIFTFVTSGFTHTVADMTLSFIGMLNHADVSVGKYIWKLLIPAVVGNIIGGFSFSLVVPFYLHLIVVERDRKRLSLPEYEARDEQPELNFDSRVVRVTPYEDKIDQDEAQEEEESDAISEKKGLQDSNSMNSHESLSNVRPLLSSISVSPSSSVHEEGSSLVADTNDTASLASESFFPRAYTVSAVHSNGITRTSTLKSNLTNRSARSRRSRVLRSPPGVFPVRGMGEPLARERTIENPNSGPEKKYYQGPPMQKVNSPTPLDRTLSRQTTGLSLNSNNIYENTDQDRGNSYNVLADRPGAKLERAITKLVERKPQEKHTDELPRTTQDTFPFNDPHNNDAYGEPVRRPSGAGSHHLFHAMSRQLLPKRSSSTMDDFNQDLVRAGVSKRAVVAANNVAGTSNYSLSDMQRSQTLHPKKKNSDWP